jgi:hypothetical protein
MEEWKKEARDGQAGSGLRAYGQGSRHTSVEEGDMTVWRIVPTRVTTCDEQRYPSVTRAQVVFQVEASRRRGNETNEREKSLYGDLIWTCSSSPMTVSQAVDADVEDGDSRRRVGRMAALTSGRRRRRPTKGRKLIQGP